MATPGARTKLIAGLRRVGPRCTDAAEYLGLTVHIVNKLPGDEKIYALDYEERRVMGRFDSEWSLWCAIAACMAMDLGLLVELSDVMDAAAVMCRRSGVLTAVREIA